MVKIWSYLPLNKSLLVIAALFLASFQMKGQNSYQLIKSFPIKGSIMASDELKNSYVVNNENNIIKLDSLGGLLGIYSENEYGEVTNIDATNPFTVLTYYKDFNSAISLDINMNAKRLYKFSSLGLSDVSAVCTSYDNKIWLFDEAEQKLKKMDDQYEITHESADVTLLIGGAISPNFMVERNNMVFINDPEKGIFVFDIYGTYFRTFLIPELNSFQIIDKKIVCFKENKLYAFDMRSQSDDVIKIPTDISSIIDLRVTRNYLMLLTENDIHIYKVSAG